MKLTKRMLSLALALLMMLSCIVFVGCEETLGHFTEKKMKSAYIDTFNIEGVDANDVVLDYYAGKYGDFQVAMLDAECHDPEEWTETIGGTEIKYYDANRLLAWNGKTFMTLTDAYADGKLTDDDIASIAAKFNGDVKHFYDTGDVFDYEDKIYTEIPARFWIIHPMSEGYRESNSKPYYRSHLTNALTITVDKKIASNKQDLREFLEKKYGVNITEIAHISSKENRYSLGFDFDNAISLVHMKNKLYEIPGITMVELEPFIMACKVPNDPYYAYDIEGNELWGLQSIEVEKVWDFCEGSRAVKVGILDLGVYDHVDLQGNLGVGLDCANEGTITNDTSSDHGTIIAGIIGGVGNNRLGISGVNWRVTIVPLQIQGSTGSYNIDAIETALDYASNSYETSMPISVLNLSFGMARDMYTFADTVDSLQNYPGLIVCCAGNSGADNDRHHFYPGYYGSELYEDPIENIIVVGGLNSDGDKAYCSNYGEKTVDIYAPGIDIYTTTSNNGYRMSEGTSIATPYVAGVAALLLSVNPNLTTAQLKDCILSGADQIDINIPYGLNSTQKQTVKKLNAWGAFKYMMKNYIPSYRLGTTATEINLETDRTSTYYLESHPTVKIVIPYSQTFTFTTVSTENAIDAVLYDSNMNPISISKTLTNNNKTISFTKELSSGTYYLSAYYLNTGTQDINVAISHTHEYTGYARYSDQYHVGCCACGVRNSVQSVHVFRASDEDAGDQFYTCILCGGTVDVWMGGPGMIIHAIQKVSVNGSYILTDGTVFLVDEDVEAYFNGTLVFYNPDDLPQTE